MPAASMSKAAFATVVMRLVQNGILDLDLPIQQYLPKPLPEYEKYADLQGDDRYKKLYRCGFCSEPHQRLSKLAVVRGRLISSRFTSSRTRYAYSGEGFQACTTRRRDSDRKIADHTDARRSIRAFEDDSHQHGLGGAV